MLLLPFHPYFMGPQFPSHTISLLGTADNSQSGLLRHELDLAAGGRVAVLAVGGDSPEKLRGIVVPIANYEGSSHQYEDVRYWKLGDLPIHPSNSG